MNGHASFVLCFALVLFGTAVMANDLCSGTVGGYSYSLDGLVVATGGKDVSCNDTYGNTYYYRPCLPLQLALCKGKNTPTAVCQKDSA